MTEDTNELRELAEAATPGPWVADGPIVYVDAGIQPHVCEALVIDTDATYIAAANPSTILALLDRLAAMTERAEKAERERDSSNEQLRVATQMLDSQRDNVADLRASVAALEAEVKRLREAMPSEGELRTLRDALPLRGMSDYGRITALRIVDRLDAARAKGGV